MRILVVYAGKHGTTGMCVERLQKELHGGNEIACVDLAEQTVDPAEYDLVVFGGSVYFGKLTPAARGFLRTYEKVLLQKPLGLFLVCGLTAEYEYYREKLFSRELREHAFLTLYFGGSLSTDGLRPLEKWLVKSMRSAIFEAEIEDGEYTPTLPGILPENIDRMATYVRLEVSRFTDGKA